MILLKLLIMLIESGILLKTMLGVIYAEILYHSFIPTIYGNFRSVFLFIYLSRANENLETCIPVWFEQSKN